MQCPEQGQGRPSRAYCHDRCAILEAINGQLADDEAKRLILKKLYDIASAELERYLNTEMRQLVSGVENLWSKYAMNSREIEAEREATLKTLNFFLERLDYFA